MKKNNKAFTLIELLAIIVILAIIAVITIPIILNVIENSRKGAAIDSAYGYKDAISKYYVSEMIDNQDLKLDGAYSVENGTLKNKTEEEYDIPTSGDSPSVGWVKIKDNEVTKGCLTIGEYKVELQDGKFMASGKGECDSEMPPVKFDEATSWKDIIEAVKDGDPVEDFEVGKEKTVTLTGKEDLGGTYTLRIANLPSDEEKQEGCGKEGFSETACGVVLEFADIITNHRMNPYTSGVIKSGNGNIGGWNASEMRGYLNETIYNVLPDEIKNAIIPTKVVSGHGSEDIENFVIPEDENSEGDKLYLLSTHEVFEDDDNNPEWGIDYNDTAYSLTRQLDYYKNNNVTISSNKDKSIKNYNNSPSAWRLRSANFSDYINFYIFMYTGSWSITSSSSSNSNGVAPAFRIAE